MVFSRHGTDPPGSGAPAPAALPDVPTAGWPARCRICAQLSIRGVVASDLRSKEERAAAAAL
jgi:hypothetical protein